MSLVSYRQEDVLDAARYCRDCLELGFSSASSKGRKNQDDDEWYMVADPFRVCAAKIEASKAMRRLGEKTQVFVRPESALVRNRADHSREVAIIAGQLAQALGLNVSLVDAIARGHDLGHAPFGHLGEKVISEIIGEKFRHNIFSVVVAQEVERKGQGLNLTYEVLAGMMNHSNSQSGGSVGKWLEEWKLVKVCDPFAYIFSDYNDAARYGISVPEVDSLIGEFGHNHRARVDTVVSRLIQETAAQGTVSFERSEVAKKFTELSEMMYSQIYNRFNRIREAQASALMDVYRLLCDSSLFRTAGEAAVLALLTDTDVERLSQRARNRPLIKRDDFVGTSIYEIIGNLDQKKINLTKANLSWAN